MIPIRNRTILDSIQPDFEKVTSVSKNDHVIGYHLFTKDTLSRFDIACCHNLAPLYGIPEEAATGTSSGALACYLMNNGMLNKESTDCLVFEQGYSLGRPSEIIVSLSLSNGRISEIDASGNAENIGQKQISICCK